VLLVPLAHMFSASWGTSMRQSRRKYNQNVHSLTCTALVSDVEI
jgi:hypothetical protein